MTDWQRLEQVIKWTGLSTNAFAIGIGLKRSENLYQIKRGNNGISKDLAELISVKYPGINRAWLLTGEGEMQERSVVATPPGSVTQTREERIPYYNTDAVRLVSETPNGWRNNETALQCHISVPGFGDCDFAAVNTGTGMASEIPTGAIVALKEVGKEAPVLPGEIYLVVTKDFAALRHVRLSGEEGKVLLASATGEESEDMLVERSRVERMYLVKGIIIQKVL